MARVLCVYVGPTGWSYGWLAGWMVGWLVRRLVESSRVRVRAKGCVCVCVCASERACIGGSRIGRGGETVLVSVDRALSRSSVCIETTACRYAAPSVLLNSTRTERSRAEPSRAKSSRVVAGRVECWWIASGSRSNRRRNRAGKRRTIVASRDDRFL